MKIEIKTWWGSVAFSTDAETLRDAVIAAVKSSANLYGANLYSANLSSANLRGANLRGANLSSANLSSANLSSANLDGADLRGANLRGANLSNANLSSADLRGADLSSADLRGADLRGADLSSADLSSADLRGANLSGADLRGANLPSPQGILSAHWGLLSEQLTADLMEYDANSHPDRNAFQRWAEGGSCPYDGVKVQRAANFIENRALWGKGVVGTPYNLMVRVLKEKTKQE